MSTDTPMSVVVANAKTVCVRFYDPATRRDVHVTVHNEKDGWGVPTVSWSSSSTACYASDAIGQARLLLYAAHFDIVGLATSLDNLGKLAD